MIKSHLTLLGLLAAFVILASAYSLIIPLGEAADEVPHFAYVQSLASARQMPKAEGQVSGESHQPPLYYLLAALATMWIPQTPFEAIANPDFAFDDRNIPNLLIHDARERFPWRESALAWHLARLLSIALGGVTIWATWRIAQELFPNDAFMALGAAAFVALLPSFISLSAVVNNDNLVIALASLSVLQIVRMWHRGANPRAAATLGVLLGLSALAKLSGLVVWLFAGLVFLLMGRKSGNWKMLLAPVTICYAIAAALFAPWILYNFATSGDPLGWSAILATTPIRTEPMTWQDAIGIVQGLFTSFWGRFGGALHIHLPTWIYAGLGILGVIGLGGWVGYATDSREKHLASGAQECLVLFGLFWAVMLVAYVRWSFAVLGADQARQLFPGLPLLAIFFAAGLARLFQTRPQMVFGVMSALLASLSLGSLVYLRGIFGGV